VLTCLYAPQGALYSIDPSTGTVTTRLSDSFADDGAYINQHTQVLIMSEVIDSRVRVVLASVAASSSMR